MFLPSKKDNLTQHMFLMDGNSTIRFSNLLISYVFVLEYTPSDLKKHYTLASGAHLPSINFNTIKFIIIIR